MQRSIFFISTLLCFALLAGCASMSKKECLNANWESVGYHDGKRGVHYSRLDKHRDSCAEYQVVPDQGAYRNGWEQGIRLYCTADNGYRTGQAGKAHSNICPADVASIYISGWRDGIRRYCTAENGLQHGLSGKRYNGVCPVDLDATYRDFYQLGRDVRTARSEHRKVENEVTKLEKQLTAEKGAQQHQALMQRLERLQHQEAQSDATLIALEACMNSDWFDAGFRDGEDGYPRRAGDIARVCRGYGIAADYTGYRQGWRQGNRYYCTYETGLYLGQSNQPYSGVCAGMEHQRFWRGYERGRDIYRAKRYEAHPRPAKQKASDKQHAQPKRLPARLKPVSPPSSFEKPSAGESHESRDKPMHENGVEKRQERSERDEKREHREDDRH